MINWREIFKDAAIFHWSGIDAALTPGLADVCKEAIDIAKEMGLTISYDINYRKNLWNYGKTAQEVLRPLMTSSDIMFGSEGEYALVTGDIVEHTYKKTDGTTFRVKVTPYSRSGSHIDETLWIFSDEGASLTPPQTK